MPKSVLRAVLRRMHFTLHATRRIPHDASRLVQAMSAWLVKTRRAPSRHSRDARVNGHTTTAKHNLSTPPPPRARLVYGHKTTAMHEMSTPRLQLGLWPYDHEYARNEYSPPPIPQLPPSASNNPQAPTPDLHLGLRDLGLELLHRFP